ncbi:MAG: hypothetical protein ABL985_21235 [Casimicrobium sp.]
MSIGKLQNELNSVEITLDDLLQASKAVHDLPQEDRDWQGRKIALVKLFLGQPEKAHAVETRLGAMAQLIQSGVLPMWATPVDSEGATQIAEPVWLATASEPLILKKYDAYFDKQSFLDRVLKLAEPEGSA